MVMAAAVFPEAQTKVQEELDLVISPGKGSVISIVHSIILRINICICRC